MITKETCRELNMSFGVTIVLFNRNYLKEILLGAYITPDFVFLVSAIPTLLPHAKNIYVNLQTVTLASQQRAA